MGLLNLAELVLDRLAQRDIIQVAKDENRCRITYLCWNRTVELQN